MSKKQKIIIVISSAFLGLAILLKPFLRKNNSPKNIIVHASPTVLEKKNKNNQKEKKSSVLWIILMIIGIIIVFSIIFLINKRIKKPETEKPDLKNKDNRLSGKCFISLSPYEIQIYYCSSPSIVNNSENIYNFDIQKDFPKSVQHCYQYLKIYSDFKKDLPKDLQNIYDNLKNDQNKNFFINFGKLIINFFALIDGYLLQIVSKNKTCNYPIINEMSERADFEHYVLDDVALIYRQEINFNNSQKISVQKNEQPIAFFKRVMNSDNMCFVEKNKNENIFLFERYFNLYNLIKKIATELDTFFNQKANKKIATYLEKYQKIMTVKQKIDNFLKIKASKH